jgi:hypothetical protein
VASDELLGLIATNFEPIMAALDTIDLAEFPIEPDLDPGRAPRLNDAAGGAADA